MHSKTIVIGNVGSSPEMRYLDSGTAVTNFSVASNRRWNNSQTDEPVEETTWFRVSVWGPYAETCHQHLERGRLVYIEGRLRPDPETGGPRLYKRQDETVGASYELVADVVRFLGGRETANTPAEETDEVPF